MKRKLILIAITAFVNAAFISRIDTIASPESTILLYGTVYTEDDQVYTGQMRWGKEEAFWFDFFNSQKPENEFLDYLSRDEINQLEQQHSDNNFLSLGRNRWRWNYDSDHTHQFSCQFGDIKSMTLGRGSRVKLELKTGEVIKLKGGSNDIKTDVQIIDEEMGHLKLNWDRITKVEFSQAPNDLTSYYGAPLYGTVTTEGDETFTGFVQWDHDERLGHDELNGEMKDGDVDLQFDKIASIAKTFRGSDITTQSGRSFELRSTNDVDDGNRGIIVNIAGMGRVDIPWDEFERVDFTPAPASKQNYASFSGGNEILATVATVGGDQHTGWIAYDLDESFQFEMLNGNLNDIEYKIPFRHIKSIKPINRRKAKVELKNGSIYKLEDSVDVNSDNDGVLIFDKDKDTDPTYVLWEDIEEVTIM